MSTNAKDSLTYTKYKTICMLPEEILEAYYEKATLETIEMLYGKVKKMLLELPSEESQRSIEQMASVLQDMLVRKVDYASKIKSLMKLVNCSYSDNFKQDEKTFQKVCKYFGLPENVEMVGFFDYTEFGSCRQGVAVTSEGIYAKTSMAKVLCIRWEELSKYDMEYKNCIQLKWKSGSKDTIEIYFQALGDAVQFMEVMKKMQSL